MSWNLLLLWRTFMTAVVLAVTAAAIGSILAGVWWLSFVFIGLGVGWWFSNRHRQINENIPINEHIAFALFLAAAAYAAYRGVAPVWLLLSGIAALLTWDLDGFYRQLTTATLIMEEDLIVKAHLQQLALVAAISLLIGTAVLLIQININFGVAFLLAFLAIWGLSLLLGEVAKKEDSD